ncbi:MAG: hypothetical protein KF744_08955 [Taibaiella sp.]|nr:hypothetical protein [Taibaiella sp.]
MQLLHNVHGFHVIFGLFCVVRLVFIFGKWKWLSQALSEKGTPSSFRVSGYNLIELICLCEFWQTMKSGSFNTTHLLYILIAIGVLWGFIKTPDILQAIGRGGKMPAAPNAQVSDTTDGDKGAVAG